MTKLVRGLVSAVVGLLLVVGLAVPAHAWVWKPLSEPNSFGKGEWISEGSDGAQPVAQPTYTWSCPAKKIGNDWVPSSSGNTHRIWGTSTNYISGTYDGYNLNGLPAKFLPYGSGAQFPTTIPQSFTDQYNHYFGLAAQNGVNLSCNGGWGHLFKPKNKNKQQSDWNHNTNSAVFIDNTKAGHDDPSVSGLVTSQLMVTSNGRLCQVSGYQKWINQDETDPWQIYVDTLWFIPSSRAGCQYEQSHWDTICTNSANSVIRLARGLFGSESLPGAADYYRTPGSADDGRPEWQPVYAFKPGTATTLGDAYGDGSKVGQVAAGNCGSIKNLPPGWEIASTDMSYETDRGQFSIYKGDLWKPSMFAGLTPVSPPTNNPNPTKTKPVKVSVTNKAVYKKNKRKKITQRRLKTTLKRAKLNSTVKYRVQQKRKGEWVTVKTMTVKIKNGEGTATTGKLQRKARQQYRVCVVKSKYVIATCSSTIRLR